MDKSEENKEQEGKLRNSLKEYMRVGEVFYYFVRVFKKRDPSRPSNINVRMMHGINRISIIIFFAALIFLIIRHLL